MYKRDDCTQKAVLPKIYIDIKYVLPCCTILLTYQYAEKIFLVQ